jgi:hypothetical protein
MNRPYRAPKPGNAAWSELIREVSALISDGRWHLYEHTEVPSEVIMAALSDSAVLDHLSYDGIVIENVRMRTPLNLQGLDIGVPLVLRNCEFREGLNLDGAHVRTLDLSESRLRNQSFARRLRVDDDLVLPEEITNGLDLTDAVVGRDITGNLRRARYDPDNVSDRANPDGETPQTTSTRWNALDASRLRVGGNVRLGHLETSWEGPLNLWEMDVGGSLRVVGTVATAYGPAISLFAANVAGNASLEVVCVESNPVDRSGWGNPDEVQRLWGQTSLDAEDAHFRRNLLISDSMTAWNIEMSRTRVDGALTLRKRPDASIDKPPGFAVITGATIGTLSIEKPPKSVCRVEKATGLSVGDLLDAMRDSASEARDWLDTGEFVAQPWEEFAGVYERNGQPADARRMRYWAARRATHQAPWHSKLVRQMYWLTSGHGYYPLVALVWLVLIFAAGLTVTAVTHDTFTTASTTQVSTLRVASRNGSTPPPGRVFARDCVNPAWDIACLNNVQYAISVVVPVADSQPWEPPDPVAALLLIFRILSWVFVAILLAGVTGLLKQQ